MKFCRNCGKQIGDNEVCSCTSGSAAPSPARAAPPKAAARPMPPPAQSRQTPPQAPRQAPPQAPQQTPPQMPRQAPPQSTQSPPQAPPRAAPPYAAQRPQPQPTPKATPAIIDTSAIKPFFESIKNRLGIGDSGGGASDSYERGQKIVPDNIEPSEGEIPVKQYRVAVLRTLIFMLLPPFVLPNTRAEARVQVTNKRVVLRAPGRDIFGGKTAIQHEYAIDEIAGVEVRHDYMFRFQYLIIGIFTLGLAPLIMAKMNIWLKTVPLAVVLICGGIMVSSGESTLLVLAVPAAIVLIVVYVLCFLRFCFRPNIVFRIKNKMGSADSPVDISIKGTFFTEVMPTNETDIAVREIGAIINDIQKLGDHGVQKWMV